MSVSRETLKLLDQLDVSRETREKLQAFAALLLHWNPRINLIGPADPDVVWHRHIVDSLQLIALLPASLSSGIDLGSGAGFPGLVISLATGTPFTLIEADKRKAAFLMEAARLTHAPVLVQSCRIEDCTTAKAPLITSRALAPLTKLLALAQPLISEGGICLFPKGLKVDEELAAARAEWTFKAERFTSIADPRGTILKISDVARA